MPVVDAITASSYTPAAPPMAGEIAKSAGDPGKQLQAPTIDPSDEDSQVDQVEGVLQPGENSQKKVKVIIISSDSKLGPSEQEAGPQPENRGCKRRGRPSIFSCCYFRFEYDRQRSFLPRAAKKSAPNPERRVPPVSPPESSQDSESSEDEVIGTDNPQEGEEPSAIVHPTEIKRSPTPPLSFIEAAPTPRSPSEDEIVPVVRSPRSPTVAQPGGVAQAYSSSSTEEEQLLPLREVFPSGIQAAPAHVAAAQLFQDVDQVRPVTEPPALTLETVNVCEVGDADPGKTASLTDQEVQVLHRFCEEVIPTSDAGLASSGRDLARQLKDLIKKHVDKSVRERLHRKSVDPDAP